MKYKLINILLQLIKNLTYQTNDSANVKGEDEGNWNPAGIGMLILADTGRGTCPDTGIEIVFYGTVPRAGTKIVSPITTFSSTIIVSSTIFWLGTGIKMVCWTIC